MLDALLPLDCALFRKSQPWRFYAGPTLALELSGSTAWLAGHANPAELAGFLSFCGCESAILDEAVCPPPDGWHKAETLTVFGLPQGKPLPLPAVDEALWTQLTLCREAPAARVAAALYILYLCDHLSALTIFLNSRPRTSKLGYRSKEALAGDRMMISPGFAAARASSTACCILSAC